MTRRHKSSTPTREQVQDRLKGLFLKALGAAEAAANSKERLDAIQQARTVITLHKAFTLAMPAPADGSPEDDEYKRGYKGRPTNLEDLRALLEDKLARLIEQRRADRMSDESARSLHSP